MKNLRPNSAVVKVPTLFQNHFGEQSVSSHSNLREPVHPYDPNACEVNNNYNLSINREMLIQDANNNNQSNITFSPPVILPPPRTMLSN
jgi:hypothetical protein